MDHLNFRAPVSSVHPSADIGRSFLRFGAMAADSIICFSETSPVAPDELFANPLFDPAFIAGNKGGRFASDLAKPR